MRLTLFMTESIFSYAKNRERENRRDLFVKKEKENMVET